jgi:hypothetical protein
MSWKKFVCFMGIGLLVLGFSSTVFARDNDKRMEISIQAPMDEVLCQRTPATIIVLGVPIDVSNVTFTVKGQKDTLTCWDLSGGLMAAVTLTGDAADPETTLFTATEVEIQGSADTPLKINAPLQAVDPSGTTVSALGVTVDIGSAVLLNDNKRPITASQLKADQFARLTITPDSDPLTATKVQVRVNQVSIQAALDEVDCESYPATITLLGLKVDVSKAVFGPRWHKKNLTCSDLEAGQIVDAYLTSDIPESATGLLSATQVDLRQRWWANGRDCFRQTAKINAPLQVVDTAANTVTVVGLLIDVKNAWLFSEKLESVTLDQLKTGQFAKLTLKSDLSAMTLLAHVDEVKVKGPITALDCEAQTMTVLGLAIDVTNATFGSKWKWHRGWHHGEFTCENLRVGQTVAVELINGLTAREVELRGGHDDGVMVSAPIEAVNPSSKTVTVLGLTIDMSAAKLKDDNEHTITLDQLIEGQFVDIDLTSDQTPLLAVSLIARTGTNQLHIRVFDEKGKLVTGGTVKATVTVKNGKSVIVREATGTGALILTSIPAGQAKITITRIHDGKTSKATASVPMKSNTNKLINARLKVVK